MIPISKVPQLYSLVGLRFFAALVVVSFHFLKIDAGPLKNFVSNGMVGVTLFFILSGFILSHTYVTGPGKMRGTKWAFWSARIARIYPMYLFSIILFSPIIFIWSHAPRDEQVTSGVASLLLVQNWMQQTMDGWNTWNPPGWSLSAEAFFYLVFPFACIPLSTWGARRLVPCALLLWLASLFPLLMEWFTASAVDFTFWYYCPLARLPEFILGIVCAILWNNRATNKFDTIAPYTAIISLLIVVLLMCSPIRTEYLKFGFCVPLFALLICSLACEKGWLVKALSLRPIVALGSASYSLYILHWPLWTEINYVFNKMGWRFSSPNVLFSTYIVLAILISYICFRIIEEPSSRYLRNWFAKRGATHSRNRLPNSSSVT